MECYKKTSNDKQYLQRAVGKFNYVSKFITNYGKDLKQQVQFWHSMIHPKTSLSDIFW